MKRLDMRQADLARAIGVNTSHIANIVNGKRGISNELATKIAVVIQVSESEVFRRVGISTARPTSSPLDETLFSLTGKLTDEEKQEFIDLARVKLERRERVQSNNK